MAVRTKDCLRFVTGHRIPFPVRTIWLMKWFALILGAGGVAAAATDLGMPWYLALLPSAIVLLVALKEEIREIIPAKPDGGVPLLMEAILEATKRLQTLFAMGERRLPIHNFGSGFG